MMIIGNFTDFFAKFSRNIGNSPAKTETDVKSMSKNAPVAKDAKNETGIRFSVFYESNSKKGTSYIYKEGIPLTPDQASAIGVEYATHPKAATQSLYLNIRALQDRFGIEAPIAGFDVILIPRK